MSWSAGHDPSLLSPSGGNQAMQLSLSRRWALSHNGLFERLLAAGDWPRGLSQGPQQPLRRHVDGLSHAHRVVLLPLIAKLFRINSVPRAVNCMITDRASGGAGDDDRYPCATGPTTSLLAAYLLTLLRSANSTTLVPSKSMRAKQKNSKF